MIIDRVLIIITALAIVAIVLMILGQAFGQFDSVLKTVLRPPKDDPETVELRLIAPAAVAAAVAAFSLLIVFLRQ